MPLKAKVVCFFYKDQSSCYLDWNLDFFSHKMSIKRNIYLGPVGRIGCNRRIGRNRAIGVIGVWGVVVIWGVIGV